MNTLQSIQLDPDKMVIHSTLDDGRALQSQWTRQSKGPAAESEDAFLVRMAGVIHERVKPVASTQEPKPKPAYCPECLCLFEHEDPSQSCRCGKPEPTGWRRWCANLARQIEERPDITPWRIIERAVNFPAVAEPCQPGEHKCEWNPDKTVLRCKKCGLDCT